MFGMVKKYYVLTSSPHRYPKNRKCYKQTKEVLDIATTAITLYDLEGEMHWE